MISRAYNLRGIVGSELNERVINRFSKNLVNYIYTHKLNKSILIGMDNRISSDYIKSIIQTRVLSLGVKVLDIGVCSTSELVYMLRNFRASVGVMITASHNSYEYNGIKCFNLDGESVDITDKDYRYVKKERIFEKVYDISKYKELYIRDLKNSLSKNNIKCIFDCANGATRDIVRRVFGKCKIIGADNSGRLINQFNGSDDLQNLISMCKRTKKIGFAFDGDGDRVVVISSEGNIIDGDKILYILATQFLFKGDVVVGTELTSLALEMSLKRLGIRLIREEVGIKHVCKRLKQTSSLMGGEPCGHIVIDKIGVADGVYIAILILNILNRTKLTLEQLLKDYQNNYQLCANIPLEYINTNDYTQLNVTTGTNRVVVRRSNTEPVLRVLVEGENKLSVLAQMQEIYTYLGVEYEK